MRVIDGLYYRRSTYKDTLLYSSLYYIICKLRLHLFRDCSNDIYVTANSRILDRDFYHFVIQKGRPDTLASP